MESRIERIRPGDANKVHEAAECFDHAPIPEATEKFLNSPDHHLLLGYIEDQPAGMITGVETTHPDKGTEMFLYELGVREQFRNRGLGRALVEALAGIAVGRGCYGMWVLTEDDNAAAIRTYTATGGIPGDVARSLSWNFAAG